MKVDDGMGEEGSEELRLLDEAELVAVLARELHLQLLRLFASGSPKHTMHGHAARKHRFCRSGLTHIGTNITGRT